MGFAALYAWLPWWIDGPRLRALGAKDQAGILSSDRGDALKIVAGAGALVALLYTALRHRLERAGQVTDRYTKAIAQLASERESERIGAVYALERIMRDSTPDHLTVVEVLAAFVRERAPREGGEALRRNRNGGAARTERMRSRVPVQPLVQERPAADVQAAMTVLARRPKRREPFGIDLRRTALVGIELPLGARLDRANLEMADLTEAYLGEATLNGVNLIGATLTEANLHGATLTRARLEGATLTGVNLIEATLTGADLSRATLTRAWLNRATLTGASLYEATLTGAELTGATLTRARLNRATLTGADLREATFTEVMALMPSQLSDALLVEIHGLDGVLAKDAWVLARIEACKAWEWDDPVPAATPNPIAQLSSGS